MNRQIVAVSEGAREYTWPVTVVETSGLELAGVRIDVSLGSDETPGAWTAAVVDELRDGARVVQALVDGGTPFGVYWVWLRIIDRTEVIVRRADLTLYVV